MLLEIRNFAFNLGPVKKNNQHLSCCLAVLMAYVLAIGPKQTGTRSQHCNNAGNLLIMT